MITQYFTFGCGHTFGGGAYIEIVAPTKARCREIMFETFSEKWSMQYDEASLGSLINSGMHRLMTITESETMNKAIIVDSGVIRT
ncbi:hypothetical protein VPHK294_0043 [Vibrio phage K294]